MEFFFNPINAFLIDLILFLSLQGKYFIYFRKVHSLNLIGFVKNNMEEEE